MLIITTRKKFFQEQQKIDSDSIRCVCKSGPKDMHLAQSNFDNEWIVSESTLFCFWLNPNLPPPVLQLLERQHWDLNLLFLVGNAVTAFALNLAVFLLIGKTSALTMNIAGEPLSRDPHLHPTFPNRWHAMARVRGMLGLSTANQLH